MTLADILKVRLMVSELRCLWMDAKTKNRITTRWTFDIDLHRLVFVADFTVCGISMPGFCISMLWVITEWVVLASGTSNARRVAPPGVRRRQQHLLKRRRARSSRLEHHVWLAGLVDRQQRLPCLFVDVSWRVGHVLAPATSGDVTTANLLWSWQVPEPRRCRSTAGVTGCLRRELHAWKVAGVLRRRGRSHNSQVYSTTVFILAQLNQTSAWRRSPQRWPKKRDKKTCVILFAKNQTSDQSSYTDLEFPGHW